MSAPRVRLNPAGARAILNSAEIQSVLQALAEKARDSANASLDDETSQGYEAYVKPGRNRARAVAHTTDAATRRHNAKSNALLKGL